MLPEVQQIGRFLENAGGTIDCCVTSGAGHATEIAAQLTGDIDAVLVAGGDGTVCEVINGLIGKSIPIVILGTGTENLFARELGMPLNPAQVAATLLNGQVFDCDVGIANDQYFLAVAGVGFDAECVMRLARRRQGHITHGDYFWPIWRTFWAHKFPALRVMADNDCVFEGRGAVLIGLIGHYAAGLGVFPKASLDDGLLDLCVLGCASRTELLGHAWRIFLKRHTRHTDVVYCQCHTIEIQSPDSVPIEIDGEVGGHLPLRCSVLPGAARFLRAQGPPNPLARTPANRYNR